MNKKEGKFQFNLSWPTVSDLLYFNKTSSTDQKPFSMSFCCHGRKKKSSVYLKCSFQQLLLVPKVFRKHTGVLWVLTQSTMGNVYR